MLAAAFVIRGGIKLSLLCKIPGSKVILGRAGASPGLPDGETTSWVPNPFTTLFQTQYFLFSSVSFIWAASLRKLMEKAIAAPNSATQEVVTEKHPSALEVLRLHGQGEHKAGWKYREILISKQSRNCLCWGLVILSPDPAWGSMTSCSLPKILSPGSAALQGSLSWRRHLVIGNSSSLIPSPRTSPSPISRGLLASHCSVQMGSLANNAL